MSGQAFGLTVERWLTAKIRDKVGFVLPARGAECVLRGFFGQPTNHWIFIDVSENLSQRRLISNYPLVETRLPNGTSSWDASVVLTCKRSLDESRDVRNLITSIRQNQQMDMIRHHDEAKD